MSSWIVMVALAGSLASANIPEQPKWEKSYSEARTWAIEHQKPLAIFIGNGVSGWEKVSKDGFDPKVNQLLKEKYVCVYIDTDTESGKEWAKLFAVGAKGLVIGDKAGSTQAFHHNGELSKELLAKAIEKYSDVNVARSTETVATLNPPAPVVQYQSSCPNCPNYVPSFSSCPNGNCPK